VRYQDRYYLPSRERMKALEQRDRDSAFDASLLRSQLRAADELRAEGILVPLANQSQTVADGLASANGPQWRSQAFKEYMAILNSTGGPQRGLPRTNTASDGPLSANFRAKLATERNSFSGRDERLDFEAAPAMRPPLELTNMLADLQNKTGLEAGTVNKLYLKLRVWAAASVEYADVGSPHLTRFDFCQCMINEGIVDNFDLANRIFCHFDTNNAGSIDAIKFVLGFAQFAPVVPLAQRLKLVFTLFGVENPGWLRIAETRDVLDFAVKTTGSGLRRQSLDDNVLLLLTTTGTDAEGRINLDMLLKILKDPEWREHFQHTFDDVFALATSEHSHGYPMPLHRTTYHDGREGTQPSLGTPAKVWVCGPGGSLGYGGK